MSSQAKKVQCSRFEPQTWRKTLCKNCFKTKNEHTEDTSDERRTPDIMSDLALSPEVLSGEKIIVRRSLVTPPPMDVGDFVGLGRRGSDNSSGRRTPIREDIIKSNTTSSGRSTPIPDVIERKVLDEQKSKDADVVSAKGATSGKQTPIVEEEKKGLSKEEGRGEPDSKEADDKVLKAKATDIISAKITPVIDKSKGGTAAPTAKVVETSDLSGTEIAQSPQEARNHSPLYLNGDLPTQTNQPSDSPALTPVTSPFKPAHVPSCPATATSAPPSLSETTTAPTVSAPSGKKTPREVDIDAAAAGMSAKDSEGGSKEGKTSPSGRSELSSSAINNRDFRSPAVGLESEATRTALLGAHAAPPPPQAAQEGSEVDRQSSVHQRTSSECTPASIAPCRSDEKKAVEENKSSSTGTSIATSTTPTPTSTSNSSSSSSNSGIDSAGQTSDAQTKIAKAAPAAAAAAVDSGAARSSYVQSLRIHLTSPVNTEAAAAAASGGGAVGVGGSSPDGETKNSYGIRHGGSSPAPAASNGPSLSAAPTKQDATSDTKFNAAAAAVAAAAAIGVAPIQLAKSSGELRSQEISPQKTDADDGAPNGLNASSVKAAVVVDPRSSSDSPSPPSLGRPKAEVRGLSLNSGGGGGGFAPATTATNPFVNNNNNNNNSNSNSVGSPTSGYQFVDVNDSRLSYSIIDEGGGAGGGGGGGGVGGGAGSKSSEGTFYYLTSGQEGTAAAANPAPFSPSSSDPPTPDQPKKKVTSLFHHVPGDSPGYPDEGQQSPNLRWSGNDSPVFRNQADDETAAANYSNLGGGGGGFDQAYQQQQPGSGRRRRRSRVISVDDTNAAMSGFDYQRSDAMMEGTRMVIENLREKVAQMQDQCERLEREKVAVGDLLAAKKSDYELMKDHFSESISNLELEVQRLKSEKSRLLDKLQLPESERASLAAEENEIADLKRRLEEYENRYTEVVGENEDLKQEVRDLQLEMEEMHDQFREEETMEFRELQKELENTAKNCRILQFKLRKAERRTEQLESDRTQYDEKLRHYESCFQSSDDKRRIRVLEEDLRLAKESSVRLHAEVERAEERKIKHQEELDRAKNSVNEADNKRLCLQNELDSMKHEMLKLRDQLRFDGRQEVIKTGGVYKINLPDTDAVAQLTKDLKDSVERENDLKEQLKFSEEENATMRKKLLDMEEETESMSLQLRKLSSAKSGRFTKGVKAVGGGDQGLDSEAAATESELRLQMELAEQEVKVLKRKMDELQQDNDNLLCAIKYLRSKLEQRDGARSATPIGDSKSTRDLLTRLGAAAAEEEAAAAAGGGSDGTKQQLVSSQKEVVSLKEKLEALEKEKTRLADEIQKLKSAGGADPGTTPCVKGTSSGAVETEKNIVKTIEELEQLLMQEKEKVQLVTSEKQALISNLEKEKEELKTMSEMKTNMESLQKALSDLQAERDDPAKEKSKTSLSSGSAANGVLPKDKEPASWRWEKQELEKQVNELKKKLEDIQAAEKKKSPAKSKDNGTKVTDDSKDVAKLTEDCEGHKKQLEELTKKLAEVEEKLKKTENEKVKASKELEKAAATKDKTEVVSKSKDVGISFNDDSTSTEKKKLAKDLEEEKKRNEELAKERDTVIKEKESWTSERKKLVLERDAAINDREELAAKTRKDSEVKVSSPFGLRSKVGFGGKLTDAADSAKIKELTETLEKKEAELKALKVKAETKGPGERLGFQAKELSDLKKEKERLEQDLDKSASERKTLKADIQQLKDKLKSSEDTWNKERLRLEQDVKQVNDKTKPLAKTFRGSDDSSKQEKEALIKEKLKLIEDVTKLKKDLGDVDQKRTSEKESFEKALKEKTKALAETKTSCEGLHKEIERLNAQVAGSKSASSSASSKVVTIPVQSDRSAKTTIPIQKISSSSSSSSRSSPSNSSDDQDLHRTASLAAIEETYRSRTRTLEEELDGLRDQLTSVQKDSETQAVKSQKTFTELKANFDKELTSWNKERELLKKNGKLADEYGSKMTNLDKTVEELTGKLKAEEAKRRELEVKLLAQENATKVDKTSTPTTEDKTKISEDKSATGPKSLEFRNRFEKFGGTPRPVRKMSLPSSTSTTPSSSDSGEKGGDWVGEIQRQMNEAEKARITDREELLEKMDRQKKDFELKLEAFKETTKMLDTKSQDLSTLEKKMAEVQCQMEEERSKWVKERSKLQSKLDNVQQKGREDKDKVAELTGEVKKLQLLTSSGRGATSLPSGSSTPLTPSTPMGSEKPNFRIKTSENPSAPKTHPTTSIVIPIRKIEDDRKKIPSSSSATADDGATSPAVATSNGVGKLSKKLFPFATDSQTSSNTSAKSYTPGQRTPIPINRINRSNPPKL